MIDTSEFRRVVSHFASGVTVVTTLLPLTGLTLPFISSGGTSLLSTLAGIGLADSVIMRRRRV